MSDPSDLAKEFARIRERNKRQQKEFDEAMEPLLERLRSLAAPAKRIRTKKCRRDANTSTS